MVSLGDSSTDNTSKLQTTKKRNRKCLGTILVGAQAVEEGIIDAVGGISDAFQKLYELISENKRKESEKHGKVY